MKTKIAHKMFNLLAQKANLLYKVINKQTSKKDAYPIIEEIDQQYEILKQQLSAFEDNRKN